MNSKEFYKKFESGKLDEKQDFFLWGSSIDVYDKLNEDSALLNELAKAMQNILALIFNTLIRLQTEFIQKFFWRYVLFERFEISVIRNQKF